MSSIPTPTDAIDAIDAIDETHDPVLRSWVETANDPQGDFPIQNLPFGRFRRRGAPGAWRIGVAIGEQVLDLSRADLSKPDVIKDTMAFMFETRHVLRPTPQAMASAQLQGEYYRCWQGLKKHVDPTRP